MADSDLGALSEVVPQISYDILGRIVPGSVVLVSFWVAAVGPGPAIAEVRAVLGDRAQPHLGVLADDDIVDCEAEFGGDHTEMVEDLADSSVAPPHEVEVFGEAGQVVEESQGRSPHERQGTERLAFVKAAQYQCLKVFPQQVQCLGGLAGRSGQGQCLFLHNVRVPFSCSANSRNNRRAERARRGLCRRSA